MRLRYGVPHIIFRVGNARGNFLWDPQIQLSYVFWEASPEGEVIQTVGSACCPWPQGSVCWHAQSELRIPGISGVTGSICTDLLAVQGVILGSWAARDEYRGEAAHEILHHERLYACVQADGLAVCPSSSCAYPASVGKATRCTLHLMAGVYLGIMPTSCDRSRPIMCYSQPVCVPHTSWICTGTGSQACALLPEHIQCCTQLQPEGGHACRSTAWRCSPRSP